MGSAHLPPKFKWRCLLKMNFSVGFLISQLTRKPALEVAPTTLSTVSCNGRGLRPMTLTSEVDVDGVMMNRQAKRLSRRHFGANVRYTHTHIGPGRVGQAPRPPKYASESSR